MKCCSVCQQVKYSTAKPRGTLQPLPIPTGPWEDATMDFIIGLPNSKGYVVIMVVVDRFTKSAHFGGLKPGFTAGHVAEVFVQQVVKLHGFPRSLVTDRDPVFLRRFWEQLMKYSGTKL